MRRCSWSRPGTTMSLRHSRAHAAALSLTIVRGERRAAARAVASGRRASSEVAKPTTFENS